MAFVRRRPHQLDSKRDVLGTVSLVREINTSDPHRAHVDILDDLSLSNRLRWVNDVRSPQNFDGLHASWLDALDTEELNRRFYKELFEWFEYAIRECIFPTDQPNQPSYTEEDHIIHLITRLLFIWFIKEKKLVPDDLFIEEQIRGLLKGYNQDKGDSYYRVILQNLFFATLNTDIAKRGFSQTNPKTHRDFSRYRYAKEIADKETLIKLFEQVPFINGGLFDCLDSFEGNTRGGWRLDCFTDNVITPGRKEYGIHSIPNRLFFGTRGLINLFDRYKFTIEENTPIEQEVALDPELLGKVFENLLAAYNPETRESVRNATGSYYTPSAVVNYMVDETLVHSLTNNVKPFDGDTNYLKSRLYYLIDYEDACNDADELFTREERKDIIEKIAYLKVIDPAVGSGAFPMSILHKLTLALRRLDPFNILWKQVQLNRVSKKEGLVLSNERSGLKEINEIFEAYHDSDYGRKLYLIQNSIFGVDIQRIACQIAKLRFFITLVIEQISTDNPSNNYGIKPLPNLETRFLIADTLLTLKRPAQSSLTDPIIQQLEQELFINRERYLLSNTRVEKIKYRKIDEQLRHKLAEALRHLGFPDDTATRIAEWNPYDQNSFANWFDPEYMFGIQDGFDIVIGNPPYIQLQRDSGRLRRRYEHEGYTTLTGYGDIYQLFLERGSNLLGKSDGLLCYIISNGWLKAKYGEKTRQYILNNHTPLQLLELGRSVFDAIVDACVLLIQYDKGDNNIDCRAVNLDVAVNPKWPPAEDDWGKLYTKIPGPWCSISRIEQNIINKIESVSIPLSNTGVAISTGIKTGLNTAFIVDDATKELLTAEDPESRHIIKKVLRGKDVHAYKAKWAGYWLIYARRGTRIQKYISVYNYMKKYQRQLLKRRGSNEWYELQASPSDKQDSVFRQDKIFWRRVTERGRFSFTEDEIYAINAVCIISNGPKDYLKYLCAILNSRCTAWLMRKILPTSGTGTYQWEKAYVETIPIPNSNSTEKLALIAKVDRILELSTSNNMESDTSALEAEIDQLVYQLYRLTREEIAVVEGR